MSSQNALPTVTGFTARQLLSMTIKDRYTEKPKTVCVEFKEYLEDSECATFSDCTVEYEYEDRNVHSTNIHPITEAVLKLEQDIRKFCVDNYEEGYDCVVECWGQAQYLEYILEDNLTTVEGFVEAYSGVKSVIEDKRADAEFHKSQA